MDSTEEFIEFATAVGPRLRRTAYPLCGDWHTAQDLTQSTLARVFVAWHRINSGEGAYAYAHRTLVNCYLAGKRKGQAHGIPGRPASPIVPAGRRPLS